MDSAELIRQECDDLCAMLIEKNRRYGDSALHPIRLFSQADAVEQIRVRIDDKLSRIASGQDDDQEDVVQDLLGYLVLLRVAKRAVVKDSLTAGLAPVLPDDGDDDPAVIRLEETVVNLVADKTSRGSVPDGCLGSLCGRPQGGCRG